MKRAPLSALIFSLCCCATLRKAHGVHSNSKPNIVLVVADDLGYNDLGIRNGNKTITPHLNQLIADGVTLSSYYTFRVCAPSRASIQTGRYPWGVGWYDMSDDSKHCVDPEYKMLPQVLKEQGYRTHAVGKWDVGYIKRHCLPTYRGYETFMGYYTACTADYWMHGAPGASPAKGPCNDVDFTDSVGTEIRGATMSGPDSVNNTYDQVVFTQRAVQHIHKHAAHAQPESPLFLFLAYHNVHDACQNDRFDHALNAPLETVEMYPTTKLDTWKLQAAMTTELDYGVGNVTQALKDSGLWDNTVLIFVSDNGGPLDHSTNAPLRGGKGSEWEGGYRVEAFVSSPLLPAAVQGSNYTGMAHSSDWYATAISLAGGSSASTGPRPVDGLDLWPAITGLNLTSPRTEVIHAVQNDYFNGTGGHCPECKPNTKVASARFGDYKIILNGDQPCRMQGHNTAHVAWPSPGQSAIPFGLSSGWVLPGTNFAYSGLLAAVDETEAPRDPHCDTGLKDSKQEVCCLKSCTKCGCPGGQPFGPGGKDGCCLGVILKHNRSCTDFGPPCVLPHAPPSLPGCLFNVALDPAEVDNLRDDPAYQQLWEELRAKLAQRGMSGPPLASAFPLGEINHTATKENCVLANKTGFLMPLD